MHRRLLVFVAFLLVFVATACDPLATPAGPAPLRYRDDIVATVTKTADITYGSAVNLSGQSVTLKLDMYRPAGDTVTSRPAVVWVHGGSFCCGSKTSPEIVDEANTLARKGYVAVSIDYRVEPGGCTGSAPVETCITAINEAREDAQTAVRFLRVQASTYGVDPTRIAIGGSSAGAITALNVGYTPEDPGTGDHQGVSSAVRAVQSISGAQLASGPIDAGDAPALLFHGTEDTLVPYSWATATVDEAQAAGLLAILRTWEGEGHVPYSEHRAQILDETRNFFYSQMDLAHAAR
jgi:acetyl esterase/lipase